MNNRLLDFNLFINESSPSFKGGSSSYNIIQATGSGGPGLIMDTGSNFTTCVGACASV